MDDKNYIDDIPLQIAIAAHRGTSWSPEERGEQERHDYAATLARDWERLSGLADTDDKRAALAAAFADYRAGYRRRFIAHLEARSRCLSSMITGPSRFPTARNAKRSAAANRRAAELQAYREAALARMTRELRPELRPIMSGDSDALERLRSKLEKAERLQETMRRANALIRKHARRGPTAQIAGLEILGISEGAARELIKPDFAGRVGFADYQLANNGAEIRRLKRRIAEVERGKQAETAELRGERARLEDCPADNRVRVFFPGKPDAAVRDRLKSSGFRWSPTAGCWQAYRNDKTLGVARREAGVEEQWASR